MLAACIDHAAPRPSSSSSFSPLRSPRPMGSANRGKEHASAAATLACGQQFDVRGYCHVDMAERAAVAAAAGGQRCLNLLLLLRKPLSQVGHVRAHRLPCIVTPGWCKVRTRHPSRAVVDRAMPPARVCVEEQWRGCGGGGQGRAHGGDRPRVVSVCRAIALGRFVAMCTGTGVARRRKKEVLFCPQMRGTTE